MCVHRFAIVLDDMHSKLIDKQCRQSITDEVQIRKVLNKIPDIFQKTITLHLTDYITYDDIVTKSGRFKAANRVTNEEHATLGYFSKV